MDGSSPSYGFTDFNILSKCLLTNNMPFSEGSVLLPVFLLPPWQDYMCPLALFLLKCKDHKSRAPLEAAVTGGCSILAWMISAIEHKLRPRTASTKMNTSHKNDTFEKEWHALSTAAWPAKPLVLGAQLAGLPVLPARAFFLSGFYCFPGWSVQMVVCFSFSSLQVSLF